MTTRDLLALQLVGLGQPIELTHVVRLLGVHYDVARRRMRVLRDHGLVSAHVVAMHEANAYTLTPKGAAALGRVFPDRPWRAMSGVGKCNRDHHRPQVDAYVHFALACARSKAVRLERYLFEGDVRRAVGAAPGVLVPDAVAVFATDAGTFALAIEVDLGTEKNPSWVANRKGLPYARLAQAGVPLGGCPRWVVAVLVPTRRRLHRLCAACWDAGVPEGLFYFAELSCLDDRNVLGPAWLTARQTPDGGADLIETRLPITVPVKDPHGEAEEPSVNAASVDAQPSEPFGRSVRTGGGS